MLAFGLERDARRAIHESVDLDRFSARWVQMLLPFKMPAGRADAPSLLGGPARRALAIVPAEIAQFAHAEDQRQAQHQRYFEENDDARAHPSDPE